MDYLIRLSAAILLLSTSLNGYAGCGELDEKITALLKDKKYTEAEQLALTAKMEAPDDIKAGLSLACVYANRALPSQIFVDTQGMGLGGGETGTIKLKEGDVEKYFKPTTGHDPAYGAKAEHAFKEIIAKWKSDKRAYWRLMDYYQQAKRHEDLVAFIPHVVEAFKGEGYALVDQLLPYPARYAEENNLSEAASMFDELFKHFPKSAPIISSFGYVTLRQGDLPRAIARFESAYQLDEKDRIILGNLGNAYIYAREFRKSERYLQELIKADPAATEAYFTLGILAMNESVSGSRKTWDNYFKQNKKYPDDAQWVKMAEQISTSVDNNMNDEDLYRLAMTFNNGRASKYAIPLLAYLDRKYPDDTYYLFGLAQAYEYADLPLEAYGYAVRTAALVNKADADKTSAASINFEAGRLAYVVKKYEESLGYLRKTEIGDENFENLQYMLGMVSENLGNTKEAMKQYGACVRKDNNKTYQGYCKSNFSRLTK